MIYSVIPTSVFKKEAKKLLKKYPSLHQELLALERELQVAPNQGTALGNNIYKVRISIKSKGKGKSGGGRVITYVVTSASEVYLLSIYDKSEISTMDTQSLKNMVKELRQGK